MALTLAEKEQSLLATVALPTADDWGLVEWNPELIEKANVALVKALEEAKALESEDSPAGYVQGVFYRCQDDLHEAHPDAGFRDSEASTALARFVAINLAPAYYEAIRYRPEWANK